MYDELILLCRTKMKSHNTLLRIHPSTPGPRKNYTFLKINILCAIEHIIYIFYGNIFNLYFL